MYTGGYTWYDTRNISTTTVPDRGPGGFSAALSATAPPTPGPFQGMVALSFAGTPTLTCPIGYTTGDFSISYWVYFIDKPNTGGTSTYQYVVSGGRLQTHQYVGNTDLYYDNGGSVSFPQTGGVWTHLTYLYTTSGTTNITVYKNGVQIASANKPITAANSFQFGSSGLTFTGYLADIRVVPFKLTASQALALYQSYETGTWFIPLISAAPIPRIGLLNVVAPTILQTFLGTGAVQTFTVPTGVTGIRFFMWGAGGFSQNGNSNAYLNTGGGSGAYVEGNLATIPGQQVQIIVGGAGQTTLAWGGGSQSRFGGGGGGFSGLFSGTPAAGTVLAIAGGAGGGGTNGGGNGGGGGFSSGLSGTGTNAGGGGSQVAGGTSLAATGSQLAGGSVANADGGGGGGGWFGGGAGQGGGSASGGGGGSSTAVSSIFNSIFLNGSIGVASPTGTPTPAANETSRYWQSPYGRSGQNGLVVIGYSRAQPGMQFVPFLPPRIPGLALWLDAADASTFTLSGSSVTQWNDKSGNGRNAIGNLGTGSYSATGLNSLPTVQITASGNMRSPVAAGTFTAGVFVFVVFQKTGANQTYDTVVTRVNGGTSQPAPFDFYTYGTNTTNRLIGNGGTSAQISETITSVARRTTPTILFQGIPGVPAGSTLLWNETINGTLTNYTMGSGFSYSDTGTAIHLGTRADNATKMIGNISEVIVYAASSFSTLQRQQVEGYLAWKWGLRGNLPSTHPYLNRPPP